MKFLHFTISTIALLAAGTMAFAADPVAEAAKLATVEKHGTRDEARAQRRADVAAARAAGEVGTNEYRRNKNVAAPVAGTKESRQAARHAQREDVKRQGANGELPNTSDEWTSNKNDQEKVAGTRDERRAERREKRAEMREANRRGEIPVTTEAAVGVVR